MSELLGRHQLKVIISILALLASAPFISASEISQSGSEGPYNLEYKGAVLAHIHKIGNGYGSLPSKAMHSHLNGVGYDTVQLNTFAYMRGRKDTEVIIGHDPTMAKQFLVSEIENLHRAGFKVMLKPHIWVGGHNLDSDNWRNKIDFEDPLERKEWFSSYGEFIISEAELAEETGVEILVIGTELVGMCKFTKEWKKLIGKVRDKYSGKLTYAAEGMNAKKIEFWDSLDYIGIDAYFPLSEKSNPTLKELVSGWKKIEPEIRDLSEKYDKKVIFTEIGYKSVEGTAIKPWEWNKKGRVSQEEQALAFEATSIAFKDKPYLAGVFIWKYFTDMNSYERGNNLKGFTPYGKKAEGVISGWFVPDE
jgi:Glycoside Hydrolase Family 113